jgi:putative FmdB family regulatory protein
MPTYEYLCSDCKNLWEEVQKISEPPITVCPKCSHPTAHRQISGGSFILKGGGWYADLYSSSKPAKKEESGGSSEAKAKEGGAGDAGKAKEGAPAAKTEKSESSTAPKPAAPSSSGSSSSGGESK